MYSDISSWKGQTSKIIRRVPYIAVGAAIPIILVRVVALRAIERMNRNMPIKLKPLNKAPYILVGALFEEYYFTPIIT